MQCVNWLRDLLIRLDAVRPGNDHRVARAAQMAGHLLAPLEWGVIGMRPGCGKVRRSVLTAELFDAAPFLDQRQLLLGVQHDAVEEGRLVEGTGSGALHAGAVVAPDVDDQRVIQLIHFLDGVEQPAHVPVSILRETSKYFHLAGVQFLLGVAERVPCRVWVRPRRQLGIRRDDAEFLLALKCPLAVLIPAIVKLALVFIGPRLGDMMRRMGGAGGVIDKPRLVGVMGADGMQPLDSLVGDVVGEVVELAILALGDARGPSCPG